MPTLVVAVGAFAVLTLVLVGLLSLAGKVFVPTGPVLVTVNDGGDNDIRGEAGGTLLSLFTQAGVHLPSACGGQGTCGTCRVRVLHGGKGLLPTEAVHISRSEARDGWRLACQVKVHEDIGVELPAETFAVKRFDCTTRSSRNVSSFIREIVLELPAGDEIDFRAGSYVQIEVPPGHRNFANFDIESEYRADWDHFGLWDLEVESTDTVSRAYSLANAPKEKAILMFNVRIATPPAGRKDIPPGIASTYMFALRPGDPVAVTGPYGDFMAEESEAEMVFIGGGAGMAPMRSHILDQLERIGTRRKISFWYGARSARELFYTDLFTRLAADHENFEWQVALSDAAPEDRWDGFTGFIHEVLYLNYLRDHPAPEDVVYYICGPPVMLAACRNMLDNLGVDPENIRFDDFGG